MGLVTLNDLLPEARSVGYAVGAFNFCNAETFQSIVEAAEEESAPVIAIIGPLEIPLLQPKLIVDIAESVARDAHVPICLHLDHAPSLAMAAECLAAGFPSIMVDGSHLPFEDNVSLMQHTVQLARSYGATVEGELGALGRGDGLLGEGSNGKPSLTDPVQAHEFVERTGIDALAASLGNAHGIYQAEPDLDFRRLKEILQLVAIPVVLHGGTGLPREQFRRAVEMGMCKVNVATELVLCYGDCIKEALHAGDGRIWPATELMRVKDRMRSVVKRWIQDLGSANKAGDFYSIDGVPTHVGLARHGSK